MPMSQEFNMFTLGNFLCVNFGDLRLNFLCLIFELFELSLFQISSGEMKNFISTAKKLQVTTYVITLQMMINYYKFFLLMLYTKSVPFLFLLFLEMMNLFEALL